MNAGQILQQLLPELPKSFHVEWSKEGLQLNDGSCLHWPEDETGVVLRFDAEGEVIGEWWPDEKGYRNVAELFSWFPGQRDIVARPNLRIVRHDEEELLDE